MLHRHGRETSDITPLVTRLVWTRSILAPWHSLTVVWKTTVKDAFSRVAVGDWVVVRSAAGTVTAASQSPILAFCHIDSINSGVQMGQGGVLSTTECELSCSSWWNLLQQVNLFSPKGQVEDIGTLLSMQSWSQSVAAVAQDYVTGSLATVFKKLFDVLAAVKLPDTIAGGKTLAELIPLVHDDESRKTYAPTRTVESVDIGGGLPTRITSMLGPYQSSVGEIFNGTFVPEPLLVELFPSFERFPDTNTAVSQPGATDNTLAAFLGGWEALIYRIKPFRDRPLRESAVAYATYNHVAVEALVAERLASPILNVAPFQAAAPSVAANIRNQTGAVNQETARILSSTNGGKAIFEDDTWGYTRAKFIERRNLRSINFNRSDTVRLNASTITLSPDPSTGIEALVQMGLPITYDEEIRRHGLRILKPSWPLTLTDNAAPAENMSSASNLTGFSISYLRTICAQFMQFYKNNHLFSTGSMSLNFLEATEKKYDAKTGTGFFEKVLDLKAGETFVVALNDAEELFYGYAEAVTHTFLISDGGVEAAATNVSYTRGHFGVSEEALIKEVQVPMREVTAPPSSNTRSGSTRGSTAKPPVGCTAGVPHGGSWFESTLPVEILTKSPAWLRPWAASRGLRIPRGVLGGDIEARLLVSAASAYVIEKYWQTQAPSSKIAVLAALRRSDHVESKHFLGAAIDFSVSRDGNTPVPALASWSALSFLADERRIPLGGAGLYLNIGQGGTTNESVTADGISVSYPECGVASGNSVSPLTPNPRFPAGGSSGTHYDYRGAFGVGGPSTTWVWLDENSDGKDEYRLGETATSPLTILRERMPRVLKFFDDRGRTDQGMPVIDGTVPNIMQVLGLEPSCFAPPTET